MFEWKSMLTFKCATAHKPVEQKHKFMWVNWELLWEYIDRYGDNIIVHVNSYDTLACLSMTMCRHVLHLSLFIDQQVGEYGTEC